MKDVQNCWVRCARNWFLGRGRKGSFADGGIICAISQTQGSRCRTTKKRLAQAINAGEQASVLRPSTCSFVQWRSITIGKSLPATAISFITSLCSRSSSWADLIQGLLAKHFRRKALNERSFAPGFWGQYRFAAGLV